MILSRVAESVYWMIRYIERAENTARIITVNSNLMMDLPGGIAPGWEPILTISGVTDEFHEHYNEINERNVVKFMLLDKHNPGSLLNSIANARENIRATRSVVPRGTWEGINDLYIYLDENKARGLTRSGRYDFLEHVIRNCQLITGNLSGTMSHDQTYEFIRLGRNLERADMTSRVLEVRVGNLLPKVDEGLKPFEDIQWKSILESLAAYQMYRRHVHVRVRGSAVLGYLLQNKCFPRAILYCVEEAEHCLHRLPNNETALRTLGRVQRFINDVDVYNIEKDQLSEFINELQVLLGQVHDHLHATYFEVEHVIESDDDPEKPESRKLSSEDAA